MFIFVDTHATVWRKMRPIWVPHLMIMGLPKINLWLIFNQY